MFYIEIETKNVSFDVSKVHLKPEAYSVMLTLFCFVCILPRINKLAKLIVLPSALICTNQLSLQ